jgi:hypothetical protein
MLCGTGREGASLAPLNLAATFAIQGLVTVIAGPRKALSPAMKFLDVEQSATPGAQTRLSDRLVASQAVAGLFILSLGDEVGLGATLRANGDNLDDVLAKVDIVVLDGINIELPSTSLRLGQLADEAVVVAYKNRTTHLGIQRVARHLAQVGTTVLGGILLSRKAGVLARFRRTSTMGQASRADNAVSPSGDAAATYRSEHRPSRRNLSEGIPSSEPTEVGPAAIGHPRQGAEHEGGPTFETAWSTTKGR